MSFGGLVASALSSGVAGAGESWGDKLTADALAKRATTLENLQAANDQASIAAKGRLSSDAADKLNDQQIEAARIKRISDEKVASTLAGVNTAAAGVKAVVDADAASTQAGVNTAAAGVKAGVDADAASTKAGVDQASAGLIAGALVEKAAVANTNSVKAAGVKAGVNATAALTKANVDVNAAATKAQVDEAAAEIKAADLVIAAKTKTDTTTGAKSGWDAKSANAYFTKQAYNQLGMKFSVLGAALAGPNTPSSTDYDKARLWISVAQDRWIGTGGQEDPATIVSEVFNDAYHQQSGQAQGGQAQGGQNVLQQARDAIAAGKSVKAVHALLVKMGLDPNDL